MHSAALRRPRLCADLGNHRGHSQAQGREQPPEDAVKKGGLPAMLKVLRERRTSMMTTSSIPDEDSGGNGKVHDPMGVSSARRADVNGNRLRKYLQPSLLEKKIIRQVEHYFGDYNLPKDRFMHDQMDPQGWISMEVMLTFKRLRDLSEDVDLIMDALHKSVNKIVQVDFAERRIRRHPKNPLPEEDEARKHEIQGRTVFVSGFNRERTTLDDLLEFFENGDFGKVCCIKLRFHRSPKAKDEDKAPAEEIEDRKFLGSAFVTFESLHEAKEFINRCKTVGGVKFGSRSLRAKFQKEFFDQRIENNDDFSPDKVTRTVYVRGFDKTDLRDQELADFFSMFDGAVTVRKRVYRDNNSHEEAEGEWKFNGSVFVCFETEKAAEAFIGLHRRNPITYRGDKLRVRTQLEFYEYMGKFRKRVSEFKEQ